MDAIEKEGHERMHQAFSGGRRGRAQTSIWWHSVNSLSCEVYVGFQTYGMVYKHMIDKGARTLYGRSYDYAGRYIFVILIRRIADGDIAATTF